MTDEEKAALEWLDNWIDRGSFVTDDRIARTLKAMLVEPRLPRELNQASINWAFWQLCTDLLADLNGVGHRRAEFFATLRGRVEHELLALEVVHASDCATHNEPYMPNGHCDCGAVPGGG